MIGDAADAEEIPVNPAASIDTASAAAAIARVLRRDDERRFISSPYARILLEAVVGPNYPAQIVKIFSSNNNGVL
ncbi:unannotated protein [freshwater metagenome]|uniref:Unannotated protein n=1 Tax=freshwater metagenome TaxID=449393 RepID=A0A6J6BGV7_9ZZZZ